MKSISMIFFVSCCTLASQLVLKKGILNITMQQNIERFSVDFFLNVFRSPIIWGSFLLQGISYCLWMYVLSQHKLGVAIGLSGGFLYLMLPLFGWVVFGEKLTTYQWTGIVLISAGVYFVIIK